MTRDEIAAADVDTLRAEVERLTLDAILNAETYAQEISAAKENLRKSQRIRDELIIALRDVTMNPKSDDTRASGRTTRLILRGLIALSEGNNICVIAATTRHARDLRGQIERQAVRFRIPLDERRLLSGNFESERTGFHGVVLIDHYAIEQVEAKP